ncbi:MAG: hypothetical protein M3296_01455 [Actinomycetota bacterium]|nr:hypothetical protein [Actinomycetota bacterium]
MLLVLDEQLSAGAVIDGLAARGHEVATVAQLGAQGRSDPDVLLRVDAAAGRPWVLVTMDLTIGHELPGLRWERYAIAWLSIHEDLTGAAFERSKREILDRHADQMAGQRPGDHHTYTLAQRFTSPPSREAQLRRRL